MKLTTLPGLKLFLTLGAIALLGTPSAHALLAGPYATDANTLALFHLDEAAGTAVATNLASANSRAYAVTNTSVGNGTATPPVATNLLGAASYAGFGNAVNLNLVGALLGYDGNNNGQFDADVQAAALASADNITQSSFFNMGNAAQTSWTIEALIAPSATNQFQEIICTDSYHTRGFQFRIKNTGQLELNFITGATGTADTLVAIPSTGDHAFVANTWYHVAAVYDGANLLLYWTRLDPTNTTANLISTTAVAVGTGVGAVNAPFLIGNENRGASAEYFRGLIDEVRVSKIARSASDMMFAAPIITITQQPVSTTNVLGQPASFSVVASGVQPLRYQWRFNGTNLVNATNATLAFTAVAATNVGNYDVVITNAVAPAVTSSVVALTIYPPRNLVWGGSLNGDWDATSPNWTTNNLSSTLAYTDLDKVTFNSVGSAQPNVNLTADFSPATVTANASTDYALTAAGVGSLNGAGSFNKGGTGRFTLAVTNNLTGGTVISNGVLQLGNGGSAGSLGSGLVVNNAAIEVNRGDATLNFPTNISGSGSLTVTAGGAILSASNSYSGATLVNAGVLYARNVNALGATNTGTTIANAAQLYLDQNTDLAAEPLTLNGSGPVADGALRKGGAGVSTVSSPVTLAAETLIKLDANATLNLTNTVTAADFALGVTTDAGANCNLSGSLQLGFGGLTKGGTGTATLTASNTFLGQTTINAGTLKAASAHSFGAAPGAFVAGQIYLNGGTLGAVSNYSLSDGLRGISVGAASFIGGDAGTTITLGNDLTGFAIVTKVGAGTVVLNGVKSLSGQFNLDEGSTGVSSGIVRLMNGNPLANAVPPFSLRNNNAGSSTVQFDGSLGTSGFTQDLTLAGRNNFVVAFQNLSGSNYIGGAVSLVTGGAQYRYQSDAGVLNFLGTLAAIAPATGNRTNTFQGAGDILFSGVIADGTAVLHVVKDGVGKFTLASDNTFSGTTVVSNGTLLVHGSLAAGSVTAVGGTLGGTGVINGPVTTLAPNTLAPGSSIGTLTISNSLTLGGNVAIEVNKTLAQSNDVITVTGALANSGTGTVTVTNLGATSLAAGDKFQIFSQAVTGGSALTVTGGGASVVWTNKLALDGSIAVLATVAPQPRIVTTGISGTNFVFSGTNGSPSGQFVLLASTNVALPVVNWTRLATNNFDGSGGFTVTTVAGTNVQQRFYLLQAQ